jgi:hypothetical protein
MPKYHQGYYKLINESKYRGNSKKVIYRSSWEKIAFKWLDKSPDVLEWSSEEIVIPYVSPKDDKIHRYYPDLWMKTPNGYFVVEIKPEKETRCPLGGKNIGNRMILYAINKAKWEAASEYCNKKGWRFKIITERTLLR